MEEVEVEVEGWRLRWRRLQSQLDFWGGVLGGTIAPEKAADLLFKHGVVVVPGARRARLDRRGAAREGSAAAASSAAGGNTSAIAELLAVAQL